ncbi:MAG: arginine--tRNA ligase [bacterium]|nr:arginine--tRNA ligase [bacterium]
MLRNVLIKEISKAVGKDIDFKVFEPERPENGDFSTNVAFKVGNAEEIAGKLRKSELVREVAVKNKFINIFLKDEVLLKALGEKIEFSKKKEKINVEFVSANPTGPLTMANARGGFYGDMLSNVLEKGGYDVTREYYFNDAGNQIKLLGESIQAGLGILQKEPHHYQGKYIKDYADGIRKKIEECKKRGFVGATIGGLDFDLSGGELKLFEKPDSERVGKIANLNKIYPPSHIKFIKEIKASLKKAGIKFDVWFYEENDLRGKGEPEKVLKFLEEKNFLEKKDGAVWLGDAVLVKSDGDYTYFLVDLAYHYNKFFEREKKLDLAIDIWGADHHGYVERMKKGITALGIDPGRLKIIIMQFVRLMRGGKEVRMSKRAGEFTTMEELLNEVGLDAARWFFLSHAPETHMDFDLDLAKERSEKNPVYYVQYAYVRMQSILTKSKFQNPNAKIKEFKHSSERTLILKILRYPDILDDISKDYQVHRLTTYAYELAQTFSAFYRDVKVIGSERESELLYLVSKTKETLADLLRLMGISQPEKM